MSKHSIKLENQGVSSLMGTSIKHVVLDKEAIRFLDQQLNLYKKGIEKIQKDRKSKK